MAIYVVLSKVSPDAFHQPSEFKELAQKVRAEIQSQCPGVKWRDSYALLGRYDVVDVFEAPDEKTAAKVAMIIRAHGRSVTETFLATPWKEFLAGL